MKTWVARTIVLTSAIGLVSFFGVAGAADTPDIETVMKKVNSGKGLSKAIAKDLQESRVNWDAVTKKSKEMLELVDCLAKNDPPKGDKKSWEKLAKEYATSAKTLNTACEKKDKSGATTALGKMGRSCKTCHDAHRG
jgi:cytochrome c556